MRLNRTPCLIPIALACILPVPAAAGQRQPPAQPVSWSATLDQHVGPVRAGSDVTLLVTAKIDEGWHVYATDELPDGPRPLRISLAPGQPFTAGPLDAPDATRELDPAFDQVTAHYDKTTTFRLPIRLSGAAKPGSHQVAIEVRFQACDGRICLPGRTVKLNVPIRIEAGRPGD